MAQRPLILIHRYSANDTAFYPLRHMLKARGLDLYFINICRYVSLNNEITIEDIAEGLDRALMPRRKMVTAKRNLPFIRTE